MKRLTFLLVFLFVIATSSIGFTTSIPGGTGGNTVNYNYNSLLDVQLTTTDLGGSYSYQFNFTNTDTSEIWHFLIWTEDTVSNGNGSFPSSLDTNLSLNSVLNEYDARNLDPNLNYLNNMWYSPWNTIGLAVGGSGSAYFESTNFYSSFLYGYETLASGYAADNGGYLAAVGTTAPIPEPATMLLFALGLLGFAGAARRINR